jgi:hypothetical protein
LRPFGNDVDVVWKLGGVPSFSSFIAFSERVGEGTVVLANRADCDVTRAAFCVLRSASDAIGDKTSAGPNCKF